jgi:hypothetical protein
MAAVYTTSNGRPVFNPEASDRIGTNGPLLLQDFHLIDLLAHFDRERIPERVVHAKGAGAYGEFEVTDDITDIVSNLSYYPSLLPSLPLRHPLSLYISPLIPHRRQRPSSPKSARRHPS